MEDMLKYLIIALIVGGAVPIFISFLSHRPPRNKSGGPGNQR